jgi:hypothetical protein
MVSQALSPVQKVSNLKPLFFRVTKIGEKLYWYGDMGMGSGLEI